MSETIKMVGMVMKKQAIPHTTPQVTPNAKALMHHTIPRSRALSLVVPLWRSRLKQTAMEADIRNTPAIQPIIFRLEQNSRSMLNFTSKGLRITRTKIELTNMNSVSLRILLILHIVVSSFEIFHFAKIMIISDMQISMG